jgi:hypothetical protein
MLKIAHATFLYLKYEQIFLEIYYKLFSKVLWQELSLSLL